MIQRIAKAFTPWTIEDTFITSIVGLSLIIATLAVIIAWF